MIEAGSRHRLWLELFPSLLVSVAVPALVAKGERAGPTLVVVAGVHGDEYEGMDAIRQVFATLDPTQMCGTFVGLPVANPFAYEARARMAPLHLDGLNLARVFLGDAAGSPSRLVAHHLLEFVLRNVGPDDLFVDFHSGSADVQYASLVGWRDVPGPARDRAEDAARTDIYARLGVRTIINGRGATTAVGGTLIPPDVLAAMTEAAKAFVVLDELNAKVGEKIAVLTGAEAGYVTAGFAAGMALAAAACIAGTDPERIRRLPDSDGWANEIIIQRCHRINYDQMFRIGGGHLIEIGTDQGTKSDELPHAITSRTAAVVYIDSPYVGHDGLDFEQVVGTAHAHGVPVIVDAASTLPPVDHLRRWIRDGADLATYSGGKGIRGPLNSGLLAGRAGLIAAARANGNPHAGIGRGMKVSKEAMVGLWVPLDLFMQRDHEVEYLVHRQQAETIRGGLATRGDLRCEIDADWESLPAPIVRIFPGDPPWSPQEARDRLMRGDPPIHINAERGGLMINTHCLRPGDAEIIVDRLLAILAPNRPSRAADVESA